MRLSLHVHDHYQVWVNSSCDSWQNQSPAIKLKSTGNSSGCLHQHNAKKVLRILLHLVQRIEHESSTYRLLEVKDTQTSEKQLIEVSQVI